MLGVEIVFKVMLFNEKGGIYDYFTDKLKKKLDSRCNTF